MKKAYFTFPFILVLQTTLQGQQVVVHPIDLPEIQAPAVMDIQEIKDYQTTIEKLGQVNNNLKAQIQNLEQALKNAETENQLLQKQILETKQEMQQLVPKKEVEKLLEQINEQLKLLEQTVTEENFYLKSQLKQLRKEKTEFPELK